MGMWEDFKATLSSCSFCNLRGVCKCNILKQEDITAFHAVFRWLHLSITIALWHSTACFFLLAAENQPWSVLQHQITEISKCFHCLLWVFVSTLKWWKNDEKDVSLHFVAMLVRPRLFTSFLSYDIHLKNRLLILLALSWHSKCSVTDHILGIPNEW